MDGVMHGEITVGVNEAYLVSGDARRKVKISEERATLIADIESGLVAEIELNIEAFRAKYPNANHYRFRNEDIKQFAESFAGRPFLRDHGTGSVGSRDGIIKNSTLLGDSLVQGISITTRRGMLSYVEGQIDRFSIGWDYDAITCSVCNEDWLRCPHWPGQTYEVRDNRGSAEGALCEIIFEAPRGKETSAVNAPAVEGTGVLAQLTELKQQKEKNMGKETKPLGTEGTAGNTVVAEAPAEQNVWMKFAAKQGLEMALSASGLGDAAKEAVSNGLPEQFGPDDVTAAIERQRAVIAEADSKNVVRGHNQPADGGRVGGMRNSLDQVGEAVQALMEGRRPASAAPLTGIRELYITLSGDYEMSGMFIPENVGLANVDSSTMAGLVANALNKTVINLFNQYPHWWLPIVTERSFSTLQEVKWISLGGVGELPTVAEGAAYTELVWNDQTEVTDWVKKGGYLGITLEAIDRDDTRTIMEAPRALAQSAWLTLSKEISGIFTDNVGVGPTMSDSLPLFDAGHNNLGDLALSYAGYVATRVAMRKQQEINSGERLGSLVAPKFLLVPSDLENLALQILMSEGMQDTHKNDENPWAEGESRGARLASARERTIVIDLWENTAHWAAVADKNMYPSIGLGYRYGNTPEIFSVASPTAGLMFSNDVLPVKVRYFYAVGPTDWRGMYKQNAPQV
ncbi:MAG: hypothetical protein GY753_12755 [Gammaproteobacteria bacterium]|nr:hypothetical protein [Gammaproteobacteria bacterium]